MKYFIITAIFALAAAKAKAQANEKLTNPERIEKSDRKQVGAN